MYLFYHTDEWHSRNSRRLVYIADDLENGIAQCQAYREMTDEQAHDVRYMMQSQGNNVGYEWEVEQVEINTFLD